MKVHDVCTGAINGLGIVLEIHYQEVCYPPNAFAQQVLGSGIFLAENP
jgi:hypothetical protein